MKSVLLLQFVSVCVSVIVIYYGVVLLLLPSIIHRLWVYIQSLTIASGSLLFGSMVRALNFYPGRPDSNNTIGVTFFSSMFHSLRISCRKIGSRSGSDFTSPKMASRNHK